MCASLNQVEVVCSPRDRRGDKLSIERRELPIMRSGECEQIGVGYLL